MNNYSNNFTLECDSDELARPFDSTYNAYSTIYSDCPIQPKIETNNYTYWQIASPTTTTHNILDATAAPMDAFHVPNFDPFNSTYSSGYQHSNVCEQIPFFPSTYNEPTNWQNSNNYELLTTNYYTPANSSSFCPTQNQCIPSNSSTYVNKIRSFTSSSPSYFESSNSPNHSQEQIVDDRAIDSVSSINWSRSQSSSLTTMNSIPPKNPLNGKTRTKDKYRIVYTDRQRYALEKEFDEAKYISIPRKAALSHTLSLSERQIKIWFQNRRAKERKLTKKHHRTSSTHPLNHSNEPESSTDDEDDIERSI